MSTSDDGDLGFEYQVLSHGDVQIRHHGKLAATLRGRRAQEFLSEIDERDEVSAQQLMARLTGNYRRGNEREARNHPRNRR